MLTFFAAGGPFMWLLLVLALINLVQIVRGVVACVRREGLANPAVEARLHGILFWGAIAAVLGVLAQLTGIYNALNAIVRATAISPNVVAQGFAESFTTTIAGLTIFVVSAIAWFWLLTMLRRRPRATG